ncbi:MAG: UDP-N-acetylmuramate--L-alanine ligase [Lachnospiraceae bacterium]|nr:UDP-N-acetylmuramate--L-alanine ligase [Lachnospiraceae bacterium]
MFQFNLDKQIHVHFVGIGGISMSGLAELLLSRGFTVSGSDMKESDLTRALQAQGARISFPQSADNIKDGIDLAVYTAAIHPDNPELQEIKRREIPTLTRAQLLGQIMKSYRMPVAVAGTHGKTTTTSMLSEILMAADTDPTLSIGGILPSIGGNFRVGGKDFFVTEACEYTNSYLSFFPKLSIILNVDADHLDFFKNIEAIRDSFHHFASLLPEDGTLIINGETEGFEAVTEGLSCRIITYAAKGNDTDFDYIARDIQFDDTAHPSFHIYNKGKDLGEFHLSVPGIHNVGNATAATAAALELGIDVEIIRKSLEAFHGSERRFEKKGVWNGVTVIDDYAHHPTEIKATLAAAQKCPHKTLWVVFQPHTYSRTKALLPEFAEALCGADRVVLPDIYPARETDTLGMSSALLADEIRKRGGVADYFDSFEKIENFLKDNCINDDMLITMGAGDVYLIGENLLSR